MNHGGATYWTMIDRFLNTDGSGKPADFVEEHIIQIGNQPSLYRKNFYLQSIRLQPLRSPLAPTANKKLQLKSCVG